MWFNPHWREQKIDDQLLRGFVTLRIWCWNHKKYLRALLHSLHKSKIFRVQSSTKTISIKLSRRNQIWAKLTKGLGMTIKRIRGLIIKIQVSMRSSKWISLITCEIKTPRTSRGLPNRQTSRINSRKDQWSHLWSRIVLFLQEEVLKYPTKRLRISMILVYCLFRHQWTCHKLNRMPKETLLLCRNMVRFSCLASLNNTPEQRRRLSLLRLEGHLLPDWRSSLT